MKICVFFSDFSGCFKYRIQIPFNNLTRIDPEFHYMALPFFPNNIGEFDNFQTLINMVSNFDLIIVQRCYIYSLIYKLRQVCNFLGKKLVFETDDDYLNLPPHNPCYWGMIPDNLRVAYMDLCKQRKYNEAQVMLPIMEEHRKRGLEEYKKLIGMMDGITVSTQELKNTLYPYNKNIVVFPNNVETIYYWRDHVLENNFHFEEDGKLKVRVPETYKLVSIPDWVIFENKNIKMLKHIPRIGYSGTPSHQGGDFDTIKKGLNKIFNKHKENVWAIFLGDGYFYNQLENRGRKYFIDATPYEIYIQNYRNFDISMAPLEPNIFNMSKSDIKAVEAASWGIPCVLPNFITYNRSFKHKETTLFYNNEEEFCEYLEELITNKKLREELGNNAREYVRLNRLEALQSQARFDWYKNLIDSSVSFIQHKPNKEKVNV